MSFGSKSANGNFQLGRSPSSGALLPSNVHLVIMGRKDKKVKLAMAATNPFAKRVAAGSGHFPSSVSLGGPETGWELVEAPWRTAAGGENSASSASSCGVDAALNSAQAGSQNSGTGSKKLSRTFTVAGLGPETPSVCIPRQSGESKAKSGRRGPDYDEGKDGRYTCQECGRKPPAVIFSSRRQMARASCALGMTWRGCFTAGAIIAVVANVGPETSSKTVCIPTLRMSWTRHFGRSATGGTTCGRT